MANILYDNCFISTYHTKVKQVVMEDGLYWHLLEETIFYVESGGMTSDQGYIQKHKVLALKKDGILVWHLLDVPLEGDVQLTLDFRARLIKSQVHSAQHLISGIMQSIYGYQTIAHHVSDYENDIEFDTTVISDKQIHELQVIVNGLIRDDIMIKVFYPTKKEAEKYGPLSAFDHDKLRIVKIGGISETPCGCIHVPSLRYLQMIKIINVDKSAKGVKLKYVVGDQLLHNYQSYYQALDKAGTLLAQPFEFIEFGILKLMQENKSLNADMHIVKTKYCELLLSTLNVNEVQTKLFSDMDFKTFQLMIEQYKTLSKKPFIFIWNHLDKVHVAIGNVKDSKKVFAEIANTYSLRGGGSISFTQGGGTYADGMEKDIFDIFNKYV